MKTRKITETDTLVLPIEQHGGVVVGTNQAGADVRHTDEDMYNRYCERFSGLVGLPSFEEYTRSRNEALELGIPESFIDILEEIEATYNSFGS